MTLIVLLILAGVSLSSLFSEKGLFGRAENAGNRYNEAKAREVLETVLLTDGQMEKQTNLEYNQDDFLDDLIKKEIEGSDVKGDVAIIGEYAYELDRSVPKIGHYLGIAKDLIFPAVTVAEITQADASDNYRTAKIEITATIEEKASNGINRIEIWQNGVKLNTITCNNEKTVTTEYRANRNGLYTIKAYSKISSTEMPNAEISGSARTTVEGIVPAVEFEPNGSTEWKKEHTTTVKVRETAEKVTSMQYLWKKSSEAEPQANEFTESCSNNSTITGGNDTMTGKYYLWILVTLGTEANQRTYINGSEEFYFDNEGPEITSFISGKYSIDGLNLTATAHDDKIGITKFEFYVDNVLKDTITCDKTTESITVMSKNITGLTTGSHNCKVVVYDEENNNNNTTATGTTKLHVWQKWNCGSRIIGYKRVRRGGEMHVPVTSSQSKYMYTTCTGPDASGNYSLTGGSTIKYSQSDWKGKFGLHNGEICEYRWVIESEVDQWGIVNDVWAIYTYEAEAITEPTRGDTLIETIPTDSATSYTSGAKNSDGYWYEYKGIE